MNNAEKAFTKSRTLLNFKVKDANEDMQKLNFYLYGVSILNLVLFLIVITPIILFSVTFFIDPNLNFYFQNISELQKVLALPSKASIFIPLAFSWAFIALSFFSIFLIKPVITSIRIKNIYKNSFWISLLSFQILALLFAAFSQYNHTTYQDFFNFESRVSANIISQYDIINKVSEYFTNNIHNAYIWTTEDGIWWILFAQIVIVFMLSLSIQNAIIVDVEQLNIEKYIAYYSEKKSEFNNSKFKYFFTKTFNNSNKTLSVWTVVTACCVLVPSLIYILGISFNTTPVAKLSSFINSFPNLMQRFKGSDQIISDFDNLLGFSNKYFNYSSLPVIVMGITFSTQFYFISISIRGEKNLQSSFPKQYVIIAIELLVVLFTTFYSQFEMNKLIETWNQSIDNTTTGAKFLEEVKGLFTNVDDFNEISKYYQIDSFNKKVNWSFFNPTNVIVINVIVISFLVSSFSIIGKCIFDKSNFKKKIILRLESKRI